MKNIFYVYEHWRSDKNVCFWVGKGHGNRAFTFKRSKHYNNVIKKLLSKGLTIEVKLIAEGLLEKEALLIEVERIAFWRSKNILLTNITNGGEGCVGMRHSDETKKLIKDARKRQKILHSAETKRKISAANSGKVRSKETVERHRKLITGRKQTAEHKAKISAGNLGRVVSLETREKIGNVNRGRIHSEATKNKFSESHKGKRHSEEQRIKISTANKIRWNGNDTLKQKIRQKMLGNNHAKRKLTPEQIKEILSSSEKQCVLAKKFNIHQSHISKMKRRFNETRICQQLSMNLSSN